MYAMVYNLYSGSYTTKHKHEHIQNTSNSCLVINYKQNCNQVHKKSNHICQLIENDTNVNMMASVAINKNNNNDNKSRTMHVTLHKGLPSRQSNRKFRNCRR